MRRLRVTAATAVGLTLPLLAAAQPSAAAPSAAAPGDDASRPAAYELTGDAGGSRFEGIGVDRRERTFFVSEVTGGEIHRGDVRTGATEEWLREGADGRTTARGITTDEEGRIYIAGGPNGQTDGRPDLWVHAPDGRLLAALRVDVPGAFLDDVAIGPDGAAYFDAHHPATRPGRPVGRPAGRHAHRPCPGVHHGQGGAWPAAPRGQQVRRAGRRAASPGGRRAAAAMRAACWVVRLTVALSVGTVAACGQAAPPERAADHPSSAASEPTSQEPAPAPASTAPAPASTAPAPHPLSAAEQEELDRALIAAAWADDVPLARELIAAGADVDFEDETEQSAYLIATSEGHRELLELTLAAGADLGALDSFDGTGLIRAAERGHADVVGRLLQSGIAVDHVNRPGFTALHEAIIYGDGGQQYVDTVRLLVARGADVTLAPVGDGITPIEHARSRGQDAVAATLQAALDAGQPADPDRLVLAAALAGDADQVAVALRAGAALETRDGSGRTPLLLAATHDRVAVARLLVALGADVDALDHRHDTPWLVTGVTGSVPMLEVLIAAGPDLTIRNRFGGVSVIPAAERGHVDYVRRVVGTGIDVDHVNDSGWTALLEAVVYGDGSWRYQEIVRILLAAGADPAITDAEGRTALDHATARRQHEVARILSGG